MQIGFHRIFIASCGIIDLDGLGLCSHSVLMTTTIRRLGQAARHGMFLLVCCRACEKETTFFARDVALICNPETPLEQLPFRCSRCDARATDVMAYEVCRDRSNKKVLVWRPVEM